MRRLVGNGVRVYLNSRREARAILILSLSIPVVKTGLLGSRRVQKPYKGVNNVVGVINFL
jgi:hypothetical protein